MTKRIRKVICTSFLIVFLLGYIGTIIPSSVIASLLDVNVHALDDEPQEPGEPIVLYSIEITNENIPGSIASNEFITSDWLDGASFVETGQYEVTVNFWENQDGDEIGTNTPLNDSTVLYGHIDLMAYDDGVDVYNFDLNMTSDDVTFNGGSVEEIDVLDESTMSVVVSVPVTSASGSTEIETVRVGSATLGYLAGETPTFSAVSLESNLYTVYLERFDEVGTTNFITSNATYNQANNANLNFEFEAGKTYSYSIWLKPVNASVATISEATEIVINNTSYNIVSTGNNANTDFNGDDLIFYGVPNIVMPAAVSYLQIDMLGDTGYSNGTFTFNGGSAYVKIDGIRFSSALTNGNIQLEGTSSFVEVVATPLDGYTATVYINGQERSSSQITTNSTIEVVFEETVQEERYSLTFQTNGGSYIAPVSNQTFGTIINLNNYEPTKTDYEFEGWYLDEGLTNKISSIMLTENKTVYANWTPLKGSISITHNTPQGLDSILLNNIVLQSTTGYGYVVNGHTNTFRIVPSDGYSVASVQVTDANDVTTSFGPGSINQYLDVNVNASNSYNITITVVQGQTYTLTFETNGGSSISPLTNQLSGTVINLGNFNPTKTDYELEGWYSDEELTNKITTITMSEDKTVYANWTLVQGDITLTYNTPQGLNNIKFNGTTVNSNTLHGYITNKYNNTFEIYPLDGYKITQVQITDANSVTKTEGPKEVNESATLRVSGSTSYTISITLELVQKYSLTFETNGGSSISSLTNQYSGTVIDLSNYNPTKTDYEFEGWYSDEGLTNKINSITLTENKTVYANWTQISGDITLSYNMPQGLNNIKFNGTTVNSNTVHGYITNKNNNTFEVYPLQNYKITQVQVTNASSSVVTEGPGEENESVSVQVSGSVSYTINITLEYVEKYTLTFETNGGSSIQTVTNIINGTVVNLNNYVTTRTDYEFEGWYSDELLQNKITTITMNENKTVYANWTQVAGDITLSYNEPEGLETIAFNDSTVTSSNVHGYITSANNNTIVLSPAYLEGYTITSVQVTNANNQVTTYGPAPVNDMLTIQVPGSTSYTLVITMVKEEVLNEYNVTYNIPGLLSSNTASTITAENNYTTTLSVDNEYEVPEGSLGFILPKAIMIKVGNIPLNDDTYSYNSTTGALTISKVVITDNITIIAPALLKIRKPVLGTNEYNYNSQEINLNVTNYDERFMERTGSVSETNAGNYEVTYTLSDATYVWADETSEPITFTWKINKLNIQPSVMMSDFKVGTTPSTPVTSGNIAGAEELLEYKLKSSPETAYTTTLPTTPGLYTVRYTVFETTNYKGGVATDDFSITTDKVVVDLPLLVTKTRIYTGYDVTIDDIYDSTYVTRYYSTGYEIGEYTTIYHLKESNYEWADGTKEDKELKWNIKFATPEVTTSSKYNSVTLSWEELIDANGYQVYECNSKGESCKKLTDTTALKYTISSLKFNTNYYYKVRSYITIEGKKKYGDYTSLMKVKTKLNAPTLKASTNRYQEVKLTWKKESGTEKYYIYKCDEFGENCTELANTTSTSYTYKKAKEGAYSYYKIRAYRAKKYSAYSSLATGYRVNDDLVVTVKNTGYLKNTITVEYKEDATLYEVYKSTDDKKYTLLKSVDAYDVDEYDGLVVTDKKAKFNKKTYYKVRVHNGVNYSAYVAKNVTAKYLNAPVVTASDNRYQEVKLTWPEVSGAEKYYVYKCDEYEENCKELGTTKSAKYSDKKAKEGDYSYYKVKTYKEKKYSAYSNFVIGYRVNDDLEVTIKNTDYLKNTITIQSREDAIKYEIYKSTDGKTYSLLKTFDLNSDDVDPYALEYEYVDKKISYNKKTYYRVRVHNGVNYSAYFEKTITATKLRTPTVTTSGTIYSPKLTVTAVPQAEGYEFYHSFDEIEWTKEQKSTKTSFKKTYDEFDTHYYKVRAYKVIGTKTYYSDYVYIDEYDFY